MFFRKSYNEVISITIMPQDSHSKKKQLLVLLDSHAILHRAYHALPNFTSASGLPTGALYGFSSILLRILKELRPDYVAACYDLPAPTFRHAAYEKYKAQRPKADPEFIVQIDRSKDILKAFQIPLFEFAGFEADDILGAIVEKTKDEKDLKIIIASGDLDMLQLVKGNKVVVYTLKKGINDTIIYNEESVKKRYGFLPVAIPDFKALKGDPSDNIKGVPGIGEKTAKELLQKLNSLEDIYKNLERDEKKSGKTGIKKRVVELLKKNKEEAFFSRDLAEIRKDAPIDFKIELLRNKTRPFKKDAIKIFEELGFKSLIRRLGEADYFFSETIEATEDDFLLAGQSSFNIIAPKIIVDFKKPLKEAQEYFWFSDNLETEFLNCALKNGKIFKFTNEDFKKEKEFFKKIFDDASKQHYGYNAKNLYHFFEKSGLFFEFDFDIAIAAWLLNSELNNPSLRNIFEAAGAAEFQKPMFKFPADFSALSKNLFESRERILEKLEKEDLLKIFYDIEMPLIKILKDMERSGILIDHAKLKKISLVCEKKLKTLKENIWRFSGERFNVNSTKELRRVLFEKLRIEMKGIKKTEGGALSTRFSELVKIQEKHPVIKELISFRELFKLKSTYIDSLPLLIKEDGRLHTTFNQTGTVTGRLSSFNPNLQNIPLKGELAKEIRQSFIAPQGWKLVSLDYSQIELRIAASLSGDKKMTTAFKENRDIHSLTASEIFNVSLSEVTSEMRRKAKIINFGILYGMGTRALSEGLGIARKEAEMYRDEYFQDFQGISEYIQKTIAEAREKGYVQTFFGRKRYFQEFNSLSEAARKETERMAVNMPIQGTAADIIKIAMVQIGRFLESAASLREKVKMILQIHDELLFEIKEEAVDEATKIIKDIMEKAYEDEIKFTVEAKIGDNWGEM